jgi:phosphotransferase system HPr (HPr) family protein
MEVFIMIERTVKVETSLEARPAALFVQAASKFSSSILVKINNKTVNAKSIMGMISLGILDGQSVTISADGSDEQQAVDELHRFFSA